MTAPRGIALLAVVAGTTALATGGAARASIDPSRFGPRVDNPWFPLKPGTTFVYEGVKDGKPLRDVFAVTRRTRMVDGVCCVVVDDRGFAAGGWPSARATTTRRTTTAACGTSAKTRPS